jgi:hypothetical protein
MIISPEGKKDQEEVQALFFFSTTYLFHILRHRISNLFNLHQLHLGRGCPQARLDVSIPLLFFFRRTLQTEVSAKISTLQHLGNNDHSGEIPPTHQTMWATGFPSSASTPTG